jgi:hypothetical protein
MGEFNPDKIERAAFQNDLPLELFETLIARRKGIDRNIEYYWKCEIPCTGENGNDYATGIVEAE